MEGEVLGACRPPMSPRGEPPRHHTTSTARPNHNVVPGGGQGGAHQVLGVGRDPGEGAVEVDQEGRKEQGGPGAGAEGEAGASKATDFLIPFSLG